MYSRLLPVADRQGERGPSLAHWIETSSKEDSAVFEETIERNWEDFSRQRRTDRVLAEVKRGCRTADSASIGVWSLGHGLWQGSDSSSKVARYTNVFSGADTKDGISEVGCWRSEVGRSPRRLADPGKHRKTTGTLTWRLGGCGTSSGESTAEAAPRTQCTGAFWPAGRVANSYRC